jgi:acetolactate synthase-1/2/3 large subunit
VDRFEGEPRKGCDILVQALEREGVDTVFAYPGGASMEIHQALTRSKTISNILCRHEQGEIFAAEGYAKATGRVGVCIATSGPGATNLVTGLADAMMDSVPLVAITGQVPRRLARAGAAASRGCGASGGRARGCRIGGQQLPQAAEAAAAVQQQQQPGPSLPPPPAA